MKRIIWLLTVLSLMVSLAPGALAAPQKKTVSQLHVEGRWIYNEEGEKVRLMGANIPDLQWATGGDNDLDKRIGILLDQWNANCVRLCVHSKFWFGEEWYQNGNYTDYRNKVDDIIRQVTSRGKYVILNLHEFYAITEKNKKFWEDAANVYKNNPGVIFGLLNEPHDISWDVWKNGGHIDTKDSYGKPVQQKVYGHQQILDMLRDMGAKNVVIAGGLDWAYYFNGLTDGYDGLEHGYRLQEPEGEKAGYGIIYDTHIYPMKPEYNPWEKAIDCLVEEAPILVGEYGHWGERLFDWYDNYLCEYPYIWMNQIHDYIDRNELNYTCWSFHIGAAPAMFTNYDTFEPTNHSGIYMKHRLLTNPDTRPPEEEREYEDPSPLSTWEQVIDQDANSAKFLVWGDEVQTKTVEDGYTGKGQLIAFDRKTAGNYDSAAVADFPEGTDLSGAEWMSLRIKGDGDMRDVGIGVELSDGRIFTVDQPLDLFENWKLWFLPLSAFHGEEGLLDTTMIKSVFFTSLTDGPGSFTVDDITIGGVPYEPQAGEISISNANQEEQMTWKAWEDSESEKDDSFTLEERGVEGKTANGTPFKIYYDCPEGSYGGQARASVPYSWDLTNTDYFTFWAKGDGSYQKFTLRFELDKGTNIKEQHSNFKKRELERFCVSFEVNSNEWKQYKFRFSDLGMSDMLHKDRIRNISLFNMILESKGSLIIDGFTFTNQGEKLKEQYRYHEPVHESAPVGTLLTKYPKNEIIQIPKEFTLTAGETGYLQIHLMNKTDKQVSGEMLLEGLEIEGIEKAKYDLYPHYVSYPHYPWRDYSYSNFKIEVPKDFKTGEYTVTVKDASGNGIVPQEYTVQIVKE